VPDLAGVSETMLWSLYNRASEAQRPDSALIDPESVRNQSVIKYDFAAHFGVAHSQHALSKSTGHYGRG
jgi:O-methyltransferase involved in polyketide biosynthesis